MPRRARSWLRCASPLSGTMRAGSRRRDAAASRSAAIDLPTANAGGSQRTIPASAERSADVRPGTPLRVARTPIYSGTSSDAEALVKGADVVFATSSLEVGYDDPDITLVYQHYAPQNLASFVQRKGRGGRGLDDRPTTAVTLSIYSPRDSWWFRRPREMISPTGFQIPLNPDNYFVRRGQALTTLLDGLARHANRASAFEFGNQPSEAGNPGSWQVGRSGPRRRRLARIRSSGCTRFLDCRDGRAACFPLPISESNCARTSPGHRTCYSTPLTCQR